MWPVWIVCHILCKNPDTPGVRSRDYFRLQVDMGNGLRHQNGSKIGIETVCVTTKMSIKLHQEIEVTDSIDDIIYSLWYPLADKNAKYPDFDPSSCNRGRWIGWWHHFQSRTLSSRRLREFTWKMRKVKISMPIFLSIDNWQLLLIVKGTIKYWLLRAKTYQFSTSR
jgi:hypothetical protein